MSASEKSTKPRNKLLETVVFLLVTFFFLGIAFFTTRYYYHRIQPWIETKGWIQGSAQITSLSWKENSNAKYNKHFQIHCTYTYQYQGNQYEGQCISFSNGPDNIGRWSKNTCQWLKSSFDQGLNIFCYINPHNPNESFLVRRLKAVMILISSLFSFIMWLIGLVLAYGFIYLPILIYITGDNKTVDNWKTDYPSQPWMWNSRWRNKIIYLRSSFSLTLAWVFTIFFILYISPQLLLAYLAWQADNYWGIFLWILPACGLMMLLLTLRISIRFIKIGKSYFELVTLPGSIGGDLQGNLVFTCKNISLKDSSVTLKCENLIRSYNENDHDYQWDQKVLWEETIPCDSSYTSSHQVHFCIPLRFQIADNCRPTFDSEDDKINWKLIIKASINKKVLQYDIEIPVFQIDSK